MKTIALIALLATGCATLRPDPKVACRIVRDMSLPQASPKDLYQMSLGTPVEHEARSAWAQQITAATMGGLAAAALGGGLIMGFAFDAATQPEVRNAGYGLIGGAIGLIAGTLILSYTSRRTAESAREHLRVFADRCAR
jgi:hypothetical protein